ncbi:MAG: hypothetical protein KF861_10895 [Planctomycetaceae bacterium]|nr:hypothetical protein [Planctomycetaceae bacterium]
MQAQEIELSIGDSIQIDEHTVTIVDIEGDVVSFRVDHQEDFQLAGRDGSWEGAVPR